MATSGTSARDRVVVALIFYGLALVFLLLALFVAHGEAAQYLSDGVLIFAGSATLQLLVAVWRRSRPPDQAASQESSGD